MVAFLGGIRLVFDACVGERNNEQDYKEIFFIGGRKAWLGLGGVEREKEKLILRNQLLWL